MRTSKSWWLVGFVAAVGAVAMAVSYRRVVALRGEVERERGIAHATAGVRAEHQRLLAAQPMDGEIDRAEADRAALEAVRAEVEALRRDTLAAERASAVRPTPFVIGRAVAASEWRDAGYTTPQAALETALWAGAGGDVAALANALVMMDGRTQRAARVLWESLPEGIRRQWSSPEQMIAFFTVRDIPLGSVQVRSVADLSGWPAPAQTMNVLLTSPEGIPRATSLIFLNSGEGWRLVVTERVIARYAEVIKSSTVAPDKR